MSRRGRDARAGLVASVGRRPALAVLRPTLAGPYSLLFSTPSTSRVIVTFSLTATPPPGIGPL